MDYYVAFGFNDKGTQGLIRRLVPGFQVTLNIYLVYVL